MSLFSRIILACALISMIGCTGWHLRGKNPQTTTAKLANAIFLSGEASGTYQATLKLLKSQDLLALADNHLSITLNKESWSSRTASLNTEGLAAETELSLSIPYTISQKLNNGERKTLANSRTEIRRSYTADANDIGAKEKEERELRIDMSNAAARAIIRRLSLLAKQ